MQKSDGKYWQFAVTTGLTSLQINWPVSTMRKFVCKANYTWSVCKEEKRPHLFKTGRCGADKGEHKHRVTVNMQNTYFHFVTTLLQCETKFDTHIKRHEI
jgi:hypothetical protein